MSESKTPAGSDATGRDSGDAHWVNVVRQEFRQGTLGETDVASEPFSQFDTWWKDAQKAKVHHPDQLTLATATSDGRPSARIVLLKAVDERGFIFVTNYDSRKSQEMWANPRVAICFYWEELERQVRIEGVAEKVTAEISTAYFHSRPRAAQIGAWASPQSKVIANRRELETSVDAADKRFGSGVIPLPPNWGGVRVVPQAVEFWQGRESRLHDRLVYDKTGATWSLKRLAP